METNILITDYSSIYIDYMLLERPILFYAYDYEEYLREDRQMYFDYERVTPGAIATTDGELMQELESYIVNGNYKIEKRQNILDLFYCETGRNPVGDKLLDMIENGDLKKRKKI